MRFGGELEGRAQAGAVPMAARQPGTREVPIRGEWPLVGRGVELEQLWNATNRRGGGSVLLYGETGVGKTRLGREWMSLCRQAGLAPLTITASRAASSLPFGAFAPLLSTVQEVTAPERCTELLAQITRALVRWGESRGNGVAILVDDAHFLDEPSAILTHQLAAAGTASVVATVQSGAPTPEPVLALWKDGLASRVEVGRLSLAAMEDLLRTVLGGSVHASTLRYLADRSGGSLQFLRELVLTAVDGEALFQDLGSWRLTRPVATSPRLVDLIEARMGSLEPMERRALEAVALGEPLGVHPLRGFAGQGLLGSLERRGLLLVAPAGRRLQATLAHPLHGDVLCMRLPLLEAQMLRDELADGVEAAGARRREDMLRVSYWRLEGARTLRPDPMIVAARQACSLRDLRLAERLATAAVDAGGGFEAELLAATITARSGRWQEALQELDRVAPHAPDDTGRTQVVIARAYCLSTGLCRYDEAIEVTKEGEAGTAQGSLADEIAGRQVSILYAMGKTVAAMELAESRLPAAEGVALVDLAAITATGLARAGRIDDALATAERGLRAHHSIGLASFWDPHIHTWNRCHAFTLAGRLDEAETLAREEHQIALVVVPPQPARQALYAFSLMMVMLARGRVTSAARLGEEAAASMRQGEPRFLRSCLAVLAQTLALAGQLEEALDVMSELDGLAPAEGPDLEPILPARAWIAAMAGDMSTARALLERYAGERELGGEFATACEALHDVARLRGAAVVAKHLSALAEHVEGGLARARVEHAIALASEDPGGLEAASLAFEGIGSMLLAAEAAADAATLLRIDGQARRAQQAAWRSTTLAAQCEGARTPALAIEARAVISPREHQMASLAAGGAANKDIAERLFVSVRTVENTLQHVYAKLGIARRSDLAPLLFGPSNPATYDD